MQAPSFAHLLGTDELGRDVLAGILNGVQVSLTVGFAAALAATLIGVVIGAIAGFWGGAFDLLVMRIAEVFQVVPSFILAAVIVALRAPASRAWSASSRSSPGRRSRASCAAR